MRPGTALLLALAACATGRGPGEPHRWTGDAALSSPTPWNRDPVTGLAVRLVADGPFVLGRPMPVAVEARNFGDRTVGFDVQDFGHGPFVVFGPDGSGVAPLLPPVGTFQSFVVLAPGEVREIGGADLAHDFAVLAPGDHVVRFTGCWKWDLDGADDPLPFEAPAGSLLAGVPESAPLRLTVAPGPLAPDQELLRRLLSVLPDAWVLHRPHDVDGPGWIFRRWEVPGTAQHALFGVLPAASEGARLLGRGQTGPVWITELRLRSKGNRAPTDDAVEAELRRTFMPAMEAAIREALELR